MDSEHAVKILIIEDDADILEAISISLRIQLPQAKLTTAHLGRVGIEMAKSEALDVVILDLGLPDVDGFEVLREIRTFSPVPVIILSVISGEDNIAKGKMLGANYYIAKPYRQVELLDCIKAITGLQSPGG